jgi:DNA (cytosine-5)-methyltransferase 1
MKQIRYIKLGTHKGGRRIWLEGKRLADAGFSAGVRYTLHCDRESRSVTIELTDGAHVVSSRQSSGRPTPVIDICNQDLKELFGDGVDRIKVIIEQGFIGITIHPDDAAILERAERLKTKLEAGSPLNMGSIAHGGGVLDHALHQGLSMAGVPTRLAWAIEIEHQYLEASLANNPVWDDRSVAIEAPMQEVEPGILGKVEGLVAGLPCTGASLSGRAKNKLAFAEQHESAGSLFVAFLRIVQAANPAFVLLENVVPYRETVSMAVIRDVLTQLGYETHETILGPEMGALENRKRLCMVAVTNGVEFDFSRLQPVRQKEACLGEVLEDIPADDPVWNRYEYLTAKEARDRVAGKGFRLNVVGPDSEQVGTIGRSYMKCRTTEPFVRHPTDPLLKRLLTVREHAAVKTIPVELVGGLSTTRAHEILGQSVIHAAIVAVGRLLGQAFQRWLVTPARLASAAAIPDPSVDRPVPCQGSLF